MKLLWGKEKMLVNLSQTMFSTLHEIYFKVSVTFILLSANAFNLDQFKISSFDKELM